MLRRQLQHSIARRGGSPTQLPSGQGRPVANQIDAPADLPDPLASDVDPPSSIRKSGHTQSLADFQMNSKHLSMEHFNVDIWGPEVEDLIMKSSAQLVCICEHRLLVPSVAALRMKARGWDSKFGLSAAAPSMRRHELHPHT